MYKPTLGVDFDNTVYGYQSGWLGPDVLPDPPVPGALQFLAAATERFRVCIYSSRSHQEGGRQAMQQWLENNLLDHFGYLPLWLDKIEWPTDKPAALVSIDDRVICFDGTWPKIEDLLNFKPWNKK